MKRQLWSVYDVYEVDALVSFLAVQTAWHEVGDWNETRDDRMLVQPIFWS